MTIDPKLDLSFERTVDVAPELIWMAWTTPEHLMPWFTPAPWTTIACEIDLRPGGIFRTVMRSPERQEFPNLGCYLEIVPNRKLVWTNVLEAGFRPSPSDAQSSFGFTATVLLEPHGNGTKYTATVMHKDEEGCAKHRAMNFEEGWSKALAQLVTYVKSIGK